MVFHFQILLPSSFPYQYLNLEYLVIMLNIYYVGNSKSNAFYLFIWEHQKIQRAQ